MEKYPNLVFVDVTTKAFGWHSLFDISRLHGAVDMKSDGIASTTAGWPCNADVIQLL
jgi:hypothetical protein